MWGFSGLLDKVVFKTRNLSRNICTLVTNNTCLNRSHDWMTRTDLLPTGDLCKSSEKTPIIFPKGTTELILQNLHLYCGTAV